MMWIKDVDGNLINLALVQSIEITERISSNFRVSVKTSSAYRDLVEGDEVCCQRFLASLFDSLVARDLAIPSIYLDGHLNWL